MCNDGVTIIIFMYRCSYSRRCYCRNPTPPPNPFMRIENADGNINPVAHIILAWLFFKVSLCMKIAKSKMYTLYNIYKCGHD